ncbi:hypothetical protein A2U01_0031070, partial [Trifolium medium]|nr:hypothetical protein [Trifolium medium]
MVVFKVKFSGNESPLAFRDSDFDFEIETSGDLCYEVKKSQRGWWEQMEQHCSSLSMRLYSRRTGNWLAEDHWLDELMGDHFCATINAVLSDRDGKGDDNTAFLYSLLTCNRHLKIIVKEHETTT